MHQDHAAPVSVLGGGGGGGGGGSGGGGGGNGGGPCGAGRGEGLMRVRRAWWASRWASQVVWPAPRVAPTQRRLEWG